MGIAVTFVKRIVQCHIELPAQSVSI